MHNFELITSDPYLSQSFFSLEGEGGTIGRAAVFLRINGCNATCKFCDTSFSIAGSDKYNIVNMVDKNEFMSYLIHNFESQVPLDKVHSISITGGEPLKNIKSFKKMFDIITKVFKNVKHIIIETNGTFLSEEKNCNELQKQVYNLIKKNIKLLLSISPKLSGKICWNGEKDETVLNWYTNVIDNYNYFLSKSIDLQLKFIYSKELMIYNQDLIEYCLNNEIHNHQILIMPFTPPDPLGKDNKIWTTSKDDAARFALANNFRYSPRIHIDRKLD